MVSLHADPGTGEILKDLEVRIDNLVTASILWACSEHNREACIGCLCARNLCLQLADLASSAALAAT